MDKHRINIVILEPSKIIFEGLSALILKSENDFFFFHIDDLNEIELLRSNREISVVLINPLAVQNRQTEFIKIKNKFPEIYWIGIIYSFYDNTFQNIFDDILFITEDISVAISKINKIRNNKVMNNPNDVELTEREKDVLKWLTKGNSNKEIARILNLSIHTINTHRKNIMDKTGIRSMSGLTIYAVTKKLISLD